MELQEMIKAEGSMCVKVLGIFYIDRVLDGTKGNFMIIRLWVICFLVSINKSTAQNIYKIKDSTVFLDTINISNPKENSMIVLLGYFRNYTIFNSQTIAYSSGLVNYYYNKIKSHSKIKYLHHTFFHKNPTPKFYKEKYVSLSFNTAIPLALYLPSSLENIKEQYIIDTLDGVLINTEKQIKLGKYNYNGAIQTNHFLDIDLNSYSDTNRTQKLFSYRVKNVARTISERGNQNLIPNSFSDIFYKKDSLTYFIKHKREKKYNHVVEITELVLFKKKRLTKQAFKLLNKEKPLKIDSIEYKFRDSIYRQNLSFDVRTFIDSN